MRLAPAIAKPGRWVVTLAATLTSAYALDAIAATAGVLLAASPPLDGLPRWELLLFLAATYLTWGIGLWTNLEANWALLEATGTSTNALSKAAHDLTASRTPSRRLRKVASAIGYISTELAKEIPYYAGAFGAVLLTDAVSADDALIFLGGANLGAALYEYGLARLTRGFLAIRARRAGADRPAADRPVTIPSIATR